MLGFESKMRRLEAYELYCTPRQWELRTLCDTDHVEMRLGVDTGLDLQFMRDSCMHRLLMRWRLYVNRLHNARIQVYECQRESEFDVMEYYFQSWKSWSQSQQHSRCRRGTDMTVNCGDRLVDVLTTALPQESFERSWSQMLQLPVFHPLSAVMCIESYRFFEYDADSQ